MCGWCWPTSSLLEHNLIAQLPDTLWSGFENENSSTVRGLLLNIWTSETPGPNCWGLCRVDVEIFSVESHWVEGGGGGPCCLSSLNQLTLVYCQSQLTAWCLGRISATTVLGLASSQSVSDLRYLLSTQHLVPSIQHLPSTEGLRQTGNTTVKYSASRINLFPWPYLCFP